MRRCKHKPCTTELPPASKCADIFQKKGFCNVKCLTSHSREKLKRKAEKEARAERKKTKERLKTKSDRMRELQSVVNEYVRLRDRGRPCISCDKPDDGSHQRHASHYRSVGACSSLRFYTMNIHASCAQCNSHKSGNILEYRIRLVSRYGQSFVERLESAPKSARYSEEWIERAKKVFRKRVRLIKKRYSNY